MTPLARRALALQESAIRKLDLTVAAQRDVLFHRLNIGQPDVPTPAPLLDAIASWRPSVVAYGPSSGTPACRAAAAAYFSPWSPGITADDVAITTGGSEALAFALALVCDPGDDVLVPEPYYTNYNGFATMAGAVVRPVPTSLDAGFALPPDDVLDGLVGPNTRAILFSNPGNPTGVIYTPDDLRRVVAWAARRDLWVIADEVYRRIWFDAPPMSVLELPDAREHVIVVDSLSKTWSACGIRLGFLVSRNRDFMERAERLGQARLGPQPLAQAVAEAALALPASHYEDVRQTYQRRVHALYGALSTIPGVRTHEPQGAFYLMAQLPVEDADAFARWMVTDFRHEGESVVVAPAAGFYAERPAGEVQPGTREVRLAAVLDEARLVRAAELLRLGLERWGARG